MLQQLKIRNFLSFKDEMTFNMQPNKGTKLKDHKAMPFKGAAVLKSAATTSFPLSRIALTIPEPK